MVRYRRNFVEGRTYFFTVTLADRLVARVSDWPHSSCHRYVRQGLLPADWAGDAGDGAIDYGEPGQ